MIQSVLGGIGDNVGDEDPKGDNPLVETDDCTTDPLRGALGLIQRDQCGSQTDSKTTKDTTNDEDRKSSCRSLEGDADGEDKT